MRLKKNNPGCQCCEPEPGGDCDDCSGDTPANISVTLDIADDPCDCSELRATYQAAWDQATFDDSGNFCQWIYEDETGFECDGYEYELHIHVRLYDDGHWYVKLELGDGNCTIVNPYCQIFYFEESSGRSTPIDCTAEYSIPFDTDALYPLCSTTDPTCTLN
jgi:hypothetical protein